MSQEVWQALDIPPYFKMTEVDLSGPYAEESSAIRFTPLIHQQIIKVEGKDALSFLQGQLSCDLRDVVKEGSRLGSHCNIKGHMISLFRVMAFNDECFWLRTHHSLADKALAQLKKYIIFSTASAMLADDLYGLGIQGEKAVNCLAEILGVESKAIPTQASHSLTGDSWILTCVRNDRFELWIKPSELTPMLNKLNSQGTLIPSEQWILAEIRDGIADLRPETSEAFIPQMTNLQVFEGINFRKGCYTGQEIITRLQHRGVLKRPMYRISAKLAEAPLPGSLIHCDDKEGVGQVVLAAKTEILDHYEMLAVILKERAEQGGLWLGNHEPIEVLDLPYTLDPRLFESKR